jgi:hypothetical protein
MLTRRSIIPAPQTMPEEMVQVRIVGHAIYVRGKVCEVGSVATMSKIDAHLLKNSRPPTVEIL